MSWREDICTIAEAADEYAMGTSTISKILATMRVKPMGLARISSGKPTMLWWKREISAALTQYQDRASVVRKRNWGETMTQRLRNHYLVAAEHRRRTHWTQKER